MSSDNLFEWRNPYLPFKLSFANNHYIDGHRSLFATAGRIDMDNGLDIMKAD